MCAASCTGPTGHVSHDSETLWAGEILAVLTHGTAKLAFIHASASSGNFFAPKKAATLRPLIEPEDPKMIDGLIAGKMYGQATERTDKSGKLFALAKVRAATADGEGLIVNVIAFDASPCTALLSLDDGDSVALTGSLTPKVWTDKQGNTRPSLDMVAAQVLTAYHVTRKRRAAEAAGSAGQRPDEEKQFPPESADF